MHFISDNLYWYLICLTRILYHSWANSRHWQAEAFTVFELRNHSRRTAIETRSQDLCSLNLNSHHFVLFLAECAESHNDRIRAALRGVFEQLRSSVMLFNNILAGKAWQISRDMCWLFTFVMSFFPFSKVTLIWSEERKRDEEEHKCLFQYSDCHFDRSGWLPGTVKHLALYIWSFCISPPETTTY